MKKILRLFSMCVLVIGACIFGACQPKSKSTDINVSFETLKSVCQDNIDEWQGISVNKLGAKNSTFVSRKDSNSDSFGFVYEEDNYKIFYDNGVQYFLDNNRKYLDENPIDYDQILNQMLLDNLEVLRHFFENPSNSKNLVSSSIEYLDGTTQYKFTITLSDTNKTLSVGYFFHNAKLVKITISMGDDHADQVEISENTQIITTPQWYDNDDYKQPMLKSEVQSIATDYSLTKEWNGAHILYPDELKYSGNEIIVGRSQDEYYQIIDGQKIFCDEKYAYIFDGDTPFNKILLNDFAKIDHIQMTH